MLAALRDASGPVPQVILAAAWPQECQRSRVLAALIADGLAVRHDANLIGLPGDDISRPVLTAQTPPG